MLNIHEAQAKIFVSVRVVTCVDADYYDYRLVGTVRTEAPPKYRPSRLATICLRVEVRKPIVFLQNLGHFCLEFGLFIELHGWHIEECLGHRSVGFID